MQNRSQPVQMPQVQAGDETLIILESLLCVMREKNLLTRQDIELLCQKVDRRAAGSAESAALLPRKGGECEELSPSPQRLYRPALWREASPPGELSGVPSSNCHPGESRDQSPLDHSKSR
jgi:hypothetical protein